MFIEVTNSQGKQQLLINMKHITSIYPKNKEKGCNILMDNSLVYAIEEPYDYICKIIEKFGG